VDGEGPAGDQRRRPKRRDDPSRDGHRTSVFAAQVS
jgi:hypothetical protein